jgi:phosphoribosylformylglycinamidine synthase subunit PurS
VYTATVQVTLRPSILDPQGKAVEHAIATLGVGSITHVRMGKTVEMKVDAKDEASARVAVEEVCRKLLANPVMEDFTFQIRKT